MQPQCAARRKLARRGAPAGRPDGGPVTRARHAAWHRGLQPEVPIFVISGAIDSMVAGP
jgi:hypothetical protein